MQCVFENSSVIKNIVCSLADGVENLNMHATSNGISVCATNVSNTDMRELALTTDYFKEYTCTQDCVMGLNMPLFKKFMSTAGPTSIIKWTIASGAATMEIEISDADASKATMVKTWTIKLMDLDEEALAAPPNPEFDVSLRISTVMVSDWIKNCKLLDGHLTLGVLKDRHISVVCEADEGTLNLKQTLPSVMATIYQTSPDFTKFDFTISNKEAEYLNTMIKCAPGVDIQMNSQMPMCATSYLNKEQTSYIRMWIAPICGDDDDA